MLKGITKNTVLEFANDDGIFQISKSKQGYIVREAISEDSREITANEAEQMVIDNPNHILKTNIDRVSEKKFVEED